MAKIEPGIVHVNELDATFLQDLASRDALLWMGEGVGDGSQADSIADLASLPWSSVLSESSSSKFADLLRERKDDLRLSKQRGYLDLVALDPSEIAFPARTLPIYLLNGLEGSSDPAESVSLSRQRGLLRRYSMLKRATEQPSRLLVVLSTGQESTVENLVELWEEGFRARVVFVTTDAGEVERLEDEFRKPFSISALTVVDVPAAEFAQSTVAGYFERLSPESQRIRVRDRGKQMRVVDVSAAERDEQPILDRYDLITESKLDPILPEDLKDEEIAGFFQRSGLDWRPYAAGLPWQRDTKYRQQVLKALRLNHERGPEHNKVLFLPAEPGSGGTTLMRLYAYEAAKEGYPALVAKPVDFRPDSLEVTSYLFEMHRQVAKASETSKDKEGKVKTHVETPVLLAFDAQHWKGKNDLLVPFFKSFERSGRSVVLLIVATDDFIELIPREIYEVVDAGITHSISENNVLALGNHLNRFLEPKGTDRSESDWKRFYEMNQPTTGDFGASSSSFWIALEFWLKRQYDLGETIQSWIYNQFKTADLSLETQKEILRVAAATVERIGFPERLLKVPSDSEVPASYLLATARDAAPALGLVRDSSAVSRQWAIGHVQIARYLLNLATADRQWLASAGYGEIPNSIAFRLELLRTIACDPLLGQKAFRDLADEFATTILKLDRDGNREFFTEYSRVMSILEDMPERIWETSRLFNHHVAISRRRIASDEQYFPLTFEQKVAQLDGAAEHLQFALERIDASPNDENDLNLLNSLARTYQDLSDLHLRNKSRDGQAEKYRALASECVTRAASLNPNNSYVLETSAQDLIKKAELLVKDEPGQAAGYACEALSYLRRAMTLHSAVQRQIKLNELLSQCFQLLKGDQARIKISQLRAKRDPVGVVAFAWLLIHDSVGTTGGTDLTSVPQSVLENALEILSEIPPGKRSWIDLRLSYDILAIVAPFEFKQQLDLMDAIIVESRRSDLQTRLEHSILLFQVGRAQEGSSDFRDLRRELKESEVIVSVPERLRYLMKVGGNIPEVCDAVVTQHQHDARSYAAVRQLQNERVPFIPAQFGKARMPENSRFRCSITFGHNGPFVSPVAKSSGGSDA